MKAATLALAVATATTLGGISVVHAASGEHAGPATVTVDPGQFDRPLQNPYFPLRPGTVSRLRGTDDGERLHERVVVTDRTKLIQGVRTTVVRDVLRRADGGLAEKTRDWYATDDHGDVWYFGEATATYDEHGDLESREGSWQAGVDGAVAGRIMPARPRPTDAFRQEFRAGEAEDQAWIVQRDATTTVPFGTIHHVVRSFEWSRLEPEVISEKLYGPGLGIIGERDLAGGHETFVLVSVTHR